MLYAAPRTEVARRAAAGAGWVRTRKLRATGRADRGPAQRDAASADYGADGNGDRRTDADGPGNGDADSDGYSDADGGADVHARRDADAGRAGRQADADAAGA
jgi:hypothetical protein